MVPNVHVRTGKQVSPFGHEFIGVTIRIGEVTDPAKIKRTYEDIRSILRSEASTWKELETKDENGNFKSLTIEA